MTATTAQTGAPAVLAALLEARTGQQIAATRAWRIDTALRPLLAATGAESRCRWRCTSPKPAALRPT
jgi:chemotaxis protein methyltransferase CheR